MSTFRRVLAVSIAAAAAVALSACDSDQVGAAVVVGDHRVSVSELQDQARELAEAPGSTTPATGDLTELQIALLDRVVRHEVFGAMAEAEDIEVTQADVDSRIEEQYVSQAPDGDLSSLLAQNGYTDETFRSAVLDEMLAQELIAAHDDDQQAFADAFNAAADDLGVAVSPRYGTWGDQLQIERENTSGSISEPVEGADEAAQLDLGQ